MENMNELKFYVDSLAEIEQQIENCEQAIRIDMMNQVIETDDCGVPEISVDLTIKLKTLRQHRADLVAKISDLIREVK